MHRPDKNHLKRWVRKRLAFRMSSREVWEGMIASYIKNRRLNTGKGSE